MSAFTIWLSVSFIATLVAGSILGFNDASRGTAVPLGKRAKMTLVLLTCLWYMGMLAMYADWAANKTDAPLSSVTWAAISLYVSLLILRFWQLRCAVLFRFLIWRASN